MRFLAVFTLFVLINFPALSFSACSKDDIEFYLDKGFTQEQITQLCSASGGGSNSTETVPDYTPYQQKVIIYQDGGGPEIDKDGFNKEERLAINDLKAGGDIIKLKVTESHINYVRKVCIISGNSPEYDQRYKTCPEVAFKISRDGLIAASSGKKLLVFGTAVVTLEGDIDRKLLGNWDDYPITVRKELKRNFNWKEDGHQTDFPVRGDYSVTKIVNAMRTLSTEDPDYFDEAAKYAEEKKDDIELVEENSKKEKKKRWWNPFD